MERKLRLPWMYFRVSKTAIREAFFDFGLLGPWTIEAAVGAKDYSWAGRHVWRQRWFRIGGFAVDRIWCFGKRCSCGCRYVGVIAELQRK